MRNFIIACCAILCTLTAEATSVAVIDVDKILKDYPVVQKIDKDLQAQFGPRANKLAAQQTAISDEENDLKRNGSIMTDAQRNKLQIDIANNTNILQAQQAQFNQDLQNAQNKSMKTVLAAINQAVTQIAKTKGYDIVLQKDRTVYISDSVDISNSVLSLLVNSKKG